LKRYAIIVAGGQGLRLGAETPKQFLPVKGRPLLFYTLEKFQGIADEIILVLPGSHMDFWKELCRSANFESGAKLVEGGESRSQSVMNGLLSLNGDGVVAIHDAVRPFVSQSLIEKLFNEAILEGNAVPVVAIKESMRFRDDQGNHAVNRTDFVAVQTPQCFDIKLIRNAYLNSGTGSFTDDASVFEHSGGVIHLIEGETANIKITFREDVAFAEALLKS
jgi:2-C-methyl-D-erythritol 4-phosphate cytidylyltransferase